MKLDRTAATSLIFGGTKGIGSIIRDRFIDRGDNVYTVSRTPSDSSRHLQFDIANSVEFKADLRLNYLVFAHRYRGQDQREEFNVMVRGVEKAVAFLAGSFFDESAIVILGSNAGRYVLPEQSASYHASRGALESLTRFLAVDLGPRNIRCNCVMPTTAVKPENAGFFTPENSTRRLLEEVTPLRRMGTGSDVADVVLFFCSPHASFVTGQTIFVDGGLSSRGHESIARQLCDLERLVG